MMASLLSSVTFKASYFLLNSMRSDIVLTSVGARAEDKEKEETCPLLYLW